MSAIYSRMLATAALVGAICGARVQAADLLVAPTRLVLGANEGSEVLLSNKGADTATYRSSIVLKRMRPDGQTDDISEPSPEQQQLINMISFAPRKVTLAPGQTQTVRVAARVPPAWPAAEYRVHMLFRAVPSEGAAINAGAQDGVSIALIPVYGVTIPIVVRKGALDAQVAIKNPRLSRIEGKPMLSLDLARTGNRSVYGAISLFKPGIAGAIAEVRGIAVYNEVDQRTVTVPLPEGSTAKLTGPVIIRFTEDGNGSSKASTETTIPL